MLKSAAKAGGSGSKNSPAQRSSAPVTNGQPRSWRGPKTSAVNSAMLDKSGRGMKKDQMMSPGKGASKIVMSKCLETNTKLIAKQEIFKNCYFYFCS